MSRIANKPIALPKGVNLKLDGQEVTIKGSKGELCFTAHNLIEVQEQDGALKVNMRVVTPEARMFAGTTWASLRNMLIGVSEGFSRKLLLVGVGYRAKVTGNTVNLTLGFSHPIDHVLPPGVTAECPSQTEIILKGINKELLGQVACDLRGYRAPEPYKGKGVRYEGEHINLKETKKKK